jgi:26S proteasome regulatory subunit N12
MLELNSLPPMGAETPNAKEERILFARFLEYAVLLAVGKADKDAFQKYISSLRPYYTQYGL